jgi:hypothetical protein
VQPQSTETTPEVNGTTQNLAAVVEPDESQMTISEHPAGETTEYVSAWTKWLTEEQPEATGNLSQTPQ